MQEQTPPTHQTGRYAKPRRRTPESRFLKKVCADLTQHVGGAPTATQRLMIERLAMILLRIEIMDRDVLADKSLLGAQTDNYLACEQTASAMLLQLGLQSPPALPVVRQVEEIAA